MAAATPRVSVVRSLLLACLAAVSLTASQPAQSVWPAPQRDHKPWTRWWWPGSAVDEAGVTRQLEQIAGAGLGGVEITPIYGAKGAEDRYIDFLSPRWMAMLEYTAREARRLGLGVDMATGTGWPFGGPWVPAEDANTAMVRNGDRLRGEPTKMMVKRAAPGGEGFVLDPYSPDAMRLYLAPFTKAFATFPRGLLRSQFHDSFEYAGAGWTPKLESEFQRMHGYDLQSAQADLIGDNATDADTRRRVKSDYRETLAALHLSYLQAWVAWSHEHGFLTRNQSHGAPANLLDLYGTVDIPETELFGSTPFPIPGLRRADDEVRHDQDLPDSLVIRMASSAAHVMGRSLTSSESSTWLREHWKVALSYAKPELDRVMLDGINHIVYHGTTYSPADAPWPGWLFYASTEYNPVNTWWRDFAAMNRYIERVQSILQSGQPDNDILVYWPVFDLWDDADGLARQLTVHDVKWLTERSTGRVAQTLVKQGYSFDYISDAQLAQTKIAAGRIVTAGSRYSLLVVPAARRMPVATLEQMLRLAEQGATVLFESLPEDVPGYGGLAGRRARFRDLLAPLTFTTTGAGREARVGRGRVLLGEVRSWLPSLPVIREPIADTGAGFIRRAQAQGHDYFMANLTADAIDGWVTLGVQADAVTLLDPLTGDSGAAAVRRLGGQAQVYLQLAPGASLVLRTSRGRATNGPRWTYTVADGSPVDLQGSWRIEFTEGGPTLPPSATLSELRSWTSLGGEAERFGGTARYRLEFDRDELIQRARRSISRAAGDVETTAASITDWALDLGDVRDSARVRMNGEEVATAWSVPFAVKLGRRLKAGSNVIEIDVTNLAANRIRDMDHRGVAWKIMRDINIVDINYRPFDASGWPLTPSGLLGPVRLIPLKAVTP